MPKLDQTPDAVRPYIFHGVELRYNGSNDAYAERCPWCESKMKWNVVLDTGVWRCNKCVQGNAKDGGNVVTFLRMLHERATDPPPDLRALATSRRLLSPDTLLAWGVGVSHLTREYVVPGYGPGGKLDQLYPYRKNGDGKHHLLCTTGTQHALHGVNLYDPSKPDVFLCEGPWDGMALWEVLRIAKRTDDGGLAPTSSEAHSLAATSNVLACPGANVFRPEWAKFFAGKRVYLCYDNDHPREHPPGSGKFTQPGLDGMRRVAAALGRAEEGPAEVHWLDWGGDEKGFNVALSSGYDVRDHLGPKDGFPDSPGRRIAMLGDLLERMEPIPAEWVPGRDPTAPAGGTEITTKPCRSWKVLTDAWRKPMAWSDGLDRALSAMLSSVLSVRAVGDQLWVRILAPASTGKSVLCEALSVAKKYIVAKSTIRGFHSGFKTDGAGEKDNSLLSVLNNMTLVTKDGDTLLQSPELARILSEARDVYDRVSRTHYRHGLSRDYEGINMTWILCGTLSLLKLDQSELGERFLTSIIMENIDDEVEDEILMKVAHRVARNMGVEVGKGAAAQNDPLMTRAMQLTGGYVEYLRENATELLGGVETPEPALRYCTRLAKFVAHMRCRPSTHQDEAAEREAAFRLASQLIRLATCTAVVLNRRTLDQEVLRRVRRVALDTSRGVTFDIVRRMYDSGDQGCDVSSLATWTHQEDAKTTKLMRFLRRETIGVVEQFVPETAPGIRPRKRWRLTAKFKKLWEDVHREDQ